MRKLKKHDDFELHVKLTQAGTNYSASVECKKCNTRQTLGMSIKMRPIISNWCRHITKSTRKTTASTTMHSYFNSSTNGNKEGGVRKVVAQFQLASHTAQDTDQDSDQDDQYFRLSPPNSREGEY